jgi:hypothetical protein
MVVAEVRPQEDERGRVRRGDAGAGSIVSEAVVELRGIFPVIYTPFDAEGRIDGEDLGRLVEHLLAYGCVSGSVIGRRPGRGSSTTDRS